MDKASIIRKLDSAFSYLTVDVPTEVRIDDQSINLKKKIDDLVEVAEGENPSKAVPEVVKLERILTELLSNFMDKIRKSEIELTEAESQLNYYLGIKRAITILKGISDESFKRFNEKAERKQKAEDRKRWFDSLKDLEGV
jgi:hypothetical protein